MDFTQVLARVESSRLLKATEGLVNGAYQITLTSHADQEVSGYVRNGDGVEYGVSLTPDRAFCSCKDSMFRHTTCKHAVALALFMIRQPKTETTPVEEEQTAPPAGWRGENWNLKLGKVRPEWSTRSL